MRPWPSASSHGLDGWTEWLLATTVLALTGMRQLARTLDNQRLHGVLAQRIADRTEDLEHLSERHQRILDSVGEGIFGVDRRLRISFVNPAAAELLGWDADELLGQDACRTLCTEEHDECLLSMVMALGEAVTQSPAATAATTARSSPSRSPPPPRPDRTASTAPWWPSVTSPSAKCSTR